MSTGAIGGTTAAATPANDAFASLTSGDFIKVMMSELSNQDPFQPQDSSKLLDQFSSLRNIESSLQLQQKLSDLVLQNQISSAGGMIGKLVQGLDANNNQVQGQVLAVQVKNGAAVLQLDSGQSLDMSRVTAIAGQPQPGNSTSTSTPTSTPTGT
jgi:flagellar hook assembly protein FlgD